MHYETFDAIVVGTGAAGYQAACRLKQLGHRVAIVTEGVHCGTSRNTGSDKQTYYKLGLGGSNPDSVRQMAADLFAGGSMDGDTALCEAALSARCFLNLCELGVPFPSNRFGEYVGYKTDHDPYARATSAGPLTSRYMTEVLQTQAEKLEIPVFDHCTAVRLLTNRGRICGVLCLQDGQPVAFRCADLILATGGPAGIYADTVYPIGHTGSTGLALLAGAQAQNLELWQYGLASAAPRWNVSGTYMQVLPRFVSIDEDGTEHEFLPDAFLDPAEALSMVFLKGYQWPYDPRKAQSGSSRIDLLVHREIAHYRRRVYLDFTRNPIGLDFSRLSSEARSYLEKADALFGTPIQRLAKMNAPAIDLYRSKGVDIHNEYLPIALCAQHSNGGIAVDLWWQTSVPGLFAAGECAGTHGIRRPGGSALNSGQVGALRAAQYIHAHPGPLAETSEFEALLAACPPVPQCGASDDPRILAAQRQMSDCAGAVRDAAAIHELLLLRQKELAAPDFSALPWRLQDVLATQAAVLTAMDAAPAAPDQIREVSLTQSGFRTVLRPVRPIPESDDFFENVWRTYRENKNIF